MLTARSFPEGFQIGLASSAPQTEGHASADGKSPSIWDHFAQAGRIAGGHTLEPASDSYRRYEEDCDWLRELGIRHWRTSVQWTRILPDGTGAVNQAGIDHYHRVLDALLERGITPWVNLYHFDLPQVLEDRYGGWMDRRVVDDFAAYAEVVVRAYGDKVRHWVTINEPWCLSVGYGAGLHAPGHAGGDPDGQQAIHHGLMAHGRAVQAVRAHGGPGSVVGLVHNPKVTVPAWEAPEHIRAAKAVFLEESGPLLDALLRGGYPDSFREKFPALAVHPGDEALIAEPCDYFGLNVYGGQPVGEHDGRPRQCPWSSSYPRVEVDWMRPVPDAAYWGLRWIHELYQPRNLILSEAGAPYADDARCDDGTIADLDRIEFFQNVIRAVHRATNENIPVTGLFFWTLLDNLEWDLGYSKYFGIMEVDLATQHRRPKASFHFLKWFLE